MNQVFAAIVVVSFLVAAVVGDMGAVSQAIFTSARGAVDLALSLIGYMALFLGLMKVAEEGGLLKLLARAIRPVMVRLFPDVPPDHPAMGAMILNIAANMLGLGNAATPLGIKAMQELNRLNPTPGVASNAMVLFLAINTSGLALLPSGVVSVRAAAGSADPWSIVAPSLFATACATVVGVLVAKSLARLRAFAPPPVDPGAAATAPDTPAAALPEPPVPALDLPTTPERGWGHYALGAFLVLGLGALTVPAVWSALLPGGDPTGQDLRAFTQTAGDWVIPVLVVALVLFGAARRVKVYEVFVAGAREGFETAVRIIPYLVAVLVAVGMFRASGAMDALTATLGLATEPLGMPAEALPMAIVRPLSGSGAFGLMTEIIHTHGPDSYVGTLVGVLNGSTETTFYVLAVYFGAVGVTRVRHALVAGLSADVAGAVAAAWICSILFAHLA